MTWVALADPTQRRFSTHGIGIDRHNAPVISDAPGAPMARGTLLIEVALPATDRPTTLFGYEKADQPAHRFFAIRVVPGGGVTCIIGFGADVQHVTLEVPPETVQSSVWISLSWDTSQQTCRLAVETPGHPEFVFRDAPLTLPIFGADMRFAYTQSTTISNSVSFVALSNCVEPLGPLPGFSPTTPISAHPHSIEAQHLLRGDVVYDADRALVPVLSTLKRRLPARGSARPIRLRAPYFGLYQDIVLAACQSVCVRGTEVEYTHGCDQVLVPAGHLVNGAAAVEDPTGPIAEYVQVLMPTHTALTVAGGAVESLNIGRIRRRKAHCAVSGLSALPRRDLPEHIRPYAPTLGRSEALFLEQRRFG